MVPYINRDALALQMQVWGTGLLGLYNVMSGGAFATATTLPWRSPFSRPLAITS